MAMLLQSDRYVNITRAGIPSKVVSERLGRAAIVLKVDRRVGHTGWSEVDPVVDLTK